jgi:biopolymer transport protein ExbD
MDVFTILVFFFLVHSAEGVPGELDHLIDLPESRSDQLPVETHIVTITADSIMLDGQPVLVSDSAIDAGAALVEPLKEALLALSPSGDGDAGAPSRVTIRGDRHIPYERLDLVMRTCAEAGFGDISLAVLQRAEPG